jgi:hypothetical protein
LTIKASERLIVLFWRRILDESRELSSRPKIFGRGGTIKGKQALIVLVLEKNF